MLAPIVSMCQHWRGLSCSKTTRAVALVRQPSPVPSLCCSSFSIILTRTAAPPAFRLRAATPQRPPPRRQIGPDLRERPCETQHCAYKAPDPTVSAHSHRIQRISTSSLPNTLICGSSYRASCARRHWSSTNPPAVHSIDPCHIMIMWPTPISFVRADHYAPECTGCIDTQQTRGTHRQAGDASKCVRVQLYSAVGPTWSHSDFSF